MDSRSIKIIAAALHATIFVYVGIVFFLGQNQGWVSSMRPRPGMEPLVAALSMASLITSMLAIYFPRIMKAGDSLFFDFETITPQIQTVTIIRMALAESVAIFGIVVSFTNQMTMIIVPFAVVGLFLQILVGPFRSWIKPS